MITFSYNRKKCLVNVFQYYSDIHLEHQSKLFHLEKVDPFDFNFSQEDEVNLGSAQVTLKHNLILAGDIGCPNTEQYWNFLKRVSRTFDRVFLITGNHEYYGMSIDMVNQNIPKTISDQALDNVFFLENEALIIDDFMIVGCTLWSHIPESARLPVLQKLNDYRLIQGFDIDKNNAMHSHSVQFIKDCLDRADTTGIKNKIIVTHHAPIMDGTSDPIHTGPTNHAFSTDLPELVSRTTHWVYGHTHYNPSTPVRKNMHSNQVGYRWDRKCANYNDKAYFYTVKFNKV